MIPKEQQTAWQRWELGSLDAAAPKKPGGTGVQPPTVNELEQLREQARKEGYAAGLAEGREAGHAAGMQTGTQAGLQQVALQNEALARQWQALLDGFSLELAQADQRVSAELLTLACDLAASMIRTALPVKRELVLPLVEQAIAALPVVQRNGKIHLNPADAALVREHLHETLEQQGWHLVENVQIAAGGCRIETHSNQIDATLATRWERLMRALGQDTAWIAP